MIRPGEPARLLEGRGGKMNPKLLILHLPYKYCRLAPTAPAAMARRLSEAFAPKA